MTAASSRPISPTDIGRGPLRVGVFVDGDAIPAWQHQVLKQFCTSGTGAIDLIISVAKVASPKQPLNFVWVFLKAEAALSALLFNGDIRKRRPQIDALVPVAELRSKHFVVVNGGYPLTATERARLNELDILIDFSRFGRAAATAFAAGLTTLRLQFGEKTIVGDRFAGLHEFLSDSPVSTAKVTGRSCDGREVILRSGKFRLFRYSWSENRRRLLHRASWLLIDAARDLQRTGGIETANAQRDDGSSPTENSAQHQPRLSDAAALLRVTADRLFREVPYLLWKKHEWRLMVADDQVGTTAMNEFTHLIPPADSFWADPFPVKWNGIRCVFFEEFPLSSKRGNISYVVLPDQLPRGARLRLPAVRVLDAETHLSYPFLFEHNDKLYMIPETSKRRVIEALVATEFPARWDVAAVLMSDVSAADTTLVQHGGAWWMFTNIDRSGVGDHCSELHIFHADNPLSTQWTPHAANPVITDARRARMAGGIVLDKTGSLLRFSQAVGQAYGSRVEVSRIDVLTPADYRETLVHEIIPNWDNQVSRTHHYASWHGLQCVDAHYDVNRIPGWLRLRLPRRSNMSKLGARTASN